MFHGIVIPWLKKYIILMSCMGVWKVECLHGFPLSVWSLLAKYPFEGVVLVQVLVRLYELVSV